MLKAVLFDLDDTLFDHRHSSRSALTLLQSEYREIGDVGMDELEAVNLEILSSVHIDVLAGTLTPDQAREKRFGILLAKYGIAASSEKLRDIAMLYRAKYQSSWRAVPGAKELLSAIRESGIKTAIVSNNLVAEQMEKLGYIGLLNLLDSLTISEEAGFVKPDSRIFEIALDRLRCRPDEVVMIGDSWENDILGARNAGIATIWYNCYLTETPDKSVPEIRSLEDSNSLLKLLSSF